MQYIFPRSIGFFFTANVETGPLAVRRVSNRFSIFKALSQSCELLSHVCLSVCPSVRVPVRSNETTRLPMDGFSLNLEFENFSKICTYNLSFIKTEQE